MRVAPDRVGIRFGSGGSQILMPRGRGPGVPPRLHLQRSIGAVASAVRGGAGPRIGLGFDRRCAGSDVGHAIRGTDRDQRERWWFRADHSVGRLNVEEGPRRRSVKPP
jgi:hypothetical protein